MTGSRLEQEDIDNLKIKGRLKMAIHFPSDPDTKHLLMDALSVIQDLETLLTNLYEEIDRLEDDNDSFQDKLAEMENIEPPESCRNRLRDSGEEYPKNDCAACGTRGVINGCPFETYDWI